MNEYELRRLVEFSETTEFWDAFQKTSYGQIAAFIAMTKLGQTCGAKRKQTVINDMYRFARAYKVLNYKFISKLILLRTREIVKNFPELKTDQSKELCVRSMSLMAKKICDYNDIKFDFRYQIMPKKLVPFDLFKQLVIEVRDKGLPQYRKPGEEKALGTSKIFGLFMSLLVITG